MRHESGALDAAAEDHDLQPRGQLNELHRLNGLIGQAEIVARDHVEGETRAGHVQAWRGEKGGRMGRDQRVNMTADAMGELRRG